MCLLGYVLITNVFVSICTIFDNWLCDLICDNWQLTLLVLIVAQATFAVACFWDLSNVYECCGDLRMAPSPLDSSQLAINHHMTGWSGWIRV